jgi:hypothetical protein
MNFIKRFIRNIRLKITKFRYKSLFSVENQFKIGDIVKVHTQNDDLNLFYTFGGPGEIVDIYLHIYSDNQKSEYKWYYKVLYKNKVVIDYDENEIELDVSYMRDQKLKQIGL